ncbi:MAG: methyltransferase domain-containing protein [Gemmataceae bacterium]
MLYRCRLSLVFTIFIPSMNLRAAGKRGRPGSQEGLRGGRAIRLTVFQQLPISRFLYKGAPAGKMIWIVSDALRGGPFMKIVNTAVLEDLEAGIGLRLNLGSGPRPRPGYYNLDLLDLPGVDILADLNEPLAALPDNCAEAIHCSHTLEHVHNFLPLIREMHRITRPGGRIEVIVPHFSNPYGYSDPTHVRFFGLYSFYYFCDSADQRRRPVPNFYIHERFRISAIRIKLLALTGSARSLLDRVVSRIVDPYVNRSFDRQDWYERRLCRLLPADELHLVLEPLKTAGQVRTDENVCLNWRNSESVCRGASA